MTQEKSRTREMRRKDRRMSEAESLRLLEKAEYGFMATSGPDGLPYGIPLSFVWFGEALYVHCAHEGRKIDNIRFCEHVTFAVVGATQPVYAKNFTTYFESVLVSGTISEVVDPQKKHAVLYALAEKYLPEHLATAEKDITNSLARTAVYVVRPYAVDGKAKREQQSVSSGR